MIEIELGTPVDIPRLLDIRRAAFLDQASSVYSNQQVQALLQRDETNGMLQMIELGQLFVARQDNAAVGLAGWRDHNLYNLYVDPAFMRQGVGTKLLAAVEDQFCVKTEFDVFYIDAGLYTRPFYEAQGYTVTKEVVSSDGLAYLEMQKQIR